MRKTVIFIFIFTASLLYSKETPLIKAKAGYIINFGKESEEVFNKMQKLNNKDSADYTKSEEEFYNKYGMNSKYGNFYSDIKKEIWEVIGEDEANVKYEPVPYKIKASSCLDNDKEYSAEKLYDNSFKTAWAEGAKGYGIGEYFEYSINNYKYNKKYDFFDEKEEYNLMIPVIYEIHLFNGYVKNEKVWRENSRVKKLRMYVDGKLYGVIELMDITSQQIIILPVPIDYKKIKTKKQYKDDLIIRFEIEEVYEGTKYKDSCITELMLYTYKF